MFIGKGFVAFVAGEGFLSAMGPFVYFEVSFLSKGLVTNIATIWLLSGMNPFVTFEVTFLCKGLVAFVACKRLLFRMNMLVSPEVRFVGKGPVTFVTRKLVCFEALRRRFARLADLQLRRTRRFVVGGGSRSRSRCESEKMREFHQIFFCVGWKKRVLRCYSVSLSACPISQLVSNLTPFTDWIICTEKKT